MGNCIECKVNDRKSQSLICQECYENQINYLKTKVRDVETYDEDRITFLVRRSKELNLGHTEKDIKNMIYAGYSDELILKDESTSVWTMGSEPSKALSVSFWNSI